MTHQVVQWRYLAETTREEFEPVDDDLSQHKDRNKRILDTREWLQPKPLHIKCAAPALHHAEQRQRQSEHNDVKESSHA